MGSAGEMEWRYPLIDETNYLRDRDLQTVCKKILVTYETGSGRRYVKQVECDYGRVIKKISGKIVAWMPLPEPAKGKAKRREILPHEQDDYFKRYFT